MPRTLVALAALALVAPTGARSIDLADTRLVAEPATSGSARGLRLRQRPLGRGERRERRPPPDVAPRRRVRSALLSRRRARRLHRPLRGQHRRLRGRRRPAACPGGSPTTRATTWRWASRRTASRCCSRPRARSTPTRYTQLFTVPVGGGFPTKLKVPNASKAAVSPDGKTIAYVPARGAVRPVEALPGRLHGAHPAVRHHDVRGRAGAAAGGSRERHRPDVDLWTGSTSAPTATASSTSTPSTAPRRPSPASPPTPTSRC